VFVKLKKKYRQTENKKMFVLQVNVTTIAIEYLTVFTNYHCVDNLLCGDCCFFTFKWFKQIGYTHCIGMTGFVLKFLFSHITK